MTREGVVTHAEGVAGIVLASGMSRRFGEGNKLVARLHGTPVVRATSLAYLEGGLDAVFVIVGYEEEEVRAALSGLPLGIVSNPEFESGQSRALVRGVRALPETAQAAVIGVGDQPLLSAAVVRNLVALYRTSGRPLVVPRYAGRRGNPVLFDRSLFSELLRVEGDQGGRPVLERHRDEIVWLDVPEERTGADVDTLEDWESLQGAEDYTG